MTDMTYLFAIDTTELPKQVLMVVGGAAVGALGLGLIAQLMTRWLTMKKLPPTPTMAARGVGGVALGVLTAMWVWQNGGWGPGGVGGLGIPGNGPGTVATQPDADKTPASVADLPRDKDKTSPDNGNAPSPESVLRLEVLGNDDVRKQGGQQAVDQKRYYRVEGEPELKNLAGLRDLIQKRRDDKAPLQALYVVTRQDNPDDTAPRSDQLRTLASAFDLKVEFH